MTMSDPYSSDFDVWRALLNSLSGNVKDGGNVHVSGVTPEAIDHTAAAISGQKTVATAGTAVALGSQAIGGPLKVKALSTNAGKIYIGNDGAFDVTDANGFELSAGEEHVFSYVDDLASIMVDASVNSQSVCWIVLGVS